MTTTRQEPLVGRLLAELVLEAGDPAAQGREGALVAATRHFLAGERVDVQSLAAELGVGRATLYRWFGDRDRLLSQVLWRLSEQALLWLRRHGDGGPEHLLATVEAFMAVTSGFPPLRRFLATEPASALRALLEPDSPLVAALVDWAAELLAEAGYGGESGPSARDLAEVLVSVTSTACWARIVAGVEPDVAGAVRAVRVLLRVEGTASAGH